MINTFIPPTGIALLIAAFSICRFENQRWVRARAQGLRGSSELTGAFINITGFISLLFSLAFLIAFGFDYGWQKAIGLLILGMIASIIYSMVSTLIFRGDNFVLWMLGTVGTWILFVPLAANVSWFVVF